MPTIVECPICDTKYDIASLKDGMKLKCTRCHKVVGTISGGDLLPILETIKAPSIPKKIPTPKIAEEVYDEGESVYEEVIVRKRVPKSGARSRMETAPRAPREKPPAMLILAGLTSLVAIITVVYVTVMLYQPENIFKAPSRNTSKATTTDTNPEK